MEDLMARPVIVINNEQVRQELSQYCDWEDLPSNYDDIIYGACGQTNGTKRISHKWMFRLLQSLTHISTAEVGHILNVKRVALGDKPSSVRSIEKYTAILKVANGGIQHDMEKSGLWCNDFVKVADSAASGHSELLTDDLLSQITAKYS